VTLPPLLPFGMLGRPHGVRGAVILRPFNPGGTRVHQLALPLTVELAWPGRTRPATIVDARPFQDEGLLRFAGVETRDAAAALTHAELRLPRAALPALGPGEFYVQDFIGCEVFDPAGARLGAIRDTFWNGTHDVLEIYDDRGQERLVPAVPEFLRAVDVHARRVVIDQPEEEE
jgi:16S rRNA processing protein RimM